MYKPTIEVLGVIDSGGPALRRGRAWRSFWRALGRPFRAIFRPRPRPLQFFKPSEVAADQIRREWKP